MPTVVPVLAQVLLLVRLPILITILVPAMVKTLHFQCQRHLSPRLEIREVPALEPVYTGTIHSDSVRAKKEIVWGLQCKAAVTVKFSQVVC